MTFVSNASRGAEGRITFFKPVRLGTRPYLSYAVVVAVLDVLVALIFSSTCWQHYLRYVQGRTTDVCLTSLVLGLVICLIAVGFWFVASKVYQNESNDQFNRALRVFICSIIVISVMATLHSYRSETTLKVMSSTPVSACTIVLDHDCLVRDDDCVCTAALYYESGLIGRVSLTLPEPFIQGTKLHVVGRFHPLSESEFDRSLYMRGIAAQIQVLDISEVQNPESVSWITQLRAHILSAMQPHESDANALLAATVCGYTADMNTREVQKSFADCGISHLVAVSGGHLAVISSLLSQLSEKFSLNKKTKTLLVLFCMGIYVMFSGCSPSAVRSYMMVGIAQVVMLCNRRAHALSSLACAVIVMLSCNPCMVFDLGFQLSALSVAFILLFSEYIQLHLESLHLPASLASLLALTFSAQWATLPLTISVFGDMSFIAPVANLCIGPVMSLMLLLGLAASCICPLMGYKSFLFVPAKLLCQISIFLAEALSMVPYASFHLDIPWFVPLVCWMVAVVVYVKWKPLPMKKVSIGSVFVLIVMFGWFSYWRYFSPAEVTVLDIGQGDCILIRDHEHCMLVDAGLGKTTIDALARNHVMNVDAIVVTHWHDDHYGGVDEVLEEYKVDAFYCADGSLDDAPYEVVDALEHSPRTACIEVAEGDCIDCGSFSLECIWPQEPVSGTCNEESLGLIGRCSNASNRARFLLTGDLEVSSEEQFVDQVGSIDFLKLGHHGSEVSVNDQILSVLRPAVCVASCGYNNKYGHPTQECIDCCEGAGALFISTIQAGDVHIRFDNDGVLLRRQFG